VEKESNGEMQSKEEKPRRKFDLEERLLCFAVEAMTITESLPETRSGNHIAGQLIRCSTSPLANYAEAQSAESRADFIHKLKITLKELRETRVWLMLIQRKGICPRNVNVQASVAEVNQLISIFVKSIETAKRNRAAAAPAH
jgi:four helix bundle protein